MQSHIGRFEIQAEIGHGGFGKVFRAFDPVMNRIVAVKVLTATEDAGSFTRFKNEATAAGNLDHPNIVTVYEFGQEKNTPFIVMEYLDGEDLQHIIRHNTSLSLYQKVRIMDQVADGLYCAHRNGVLHRDVKPANIMVRKDGSIKVMDFGIARLTRDTSTRLTQQGYLIGTVVYMAPELFAGTETEVDALCDIWSYGVILYELLAGKNPFQTGNMQSEMYRIVNQDPPTIPPTECPQDLQAVLHKLLARQREARYQTLEDTRFDLQPILKNLEKSEADRLLSIAQQFMFKQQWNDALNMAREARRLDPQNGTARIIFERAQSELQRQNVRPRIDDLLRRSNDFADQRKMSEALDLLDSARKLDTTNQQVLNRLQELRALKARLEESAKLAAEAGSEFREKRLTAAFEHISEAVSLDPGNSDARRLLESIQAEIQAREAERWLESEIRRARGLIAIDDLDNAMKTLQATEAKLPGRRETRDLIARIQQLIAERDRRRDFSRRLDLAKESVRQARFNEAVKELEELLASFPNEVEATDLLSYARQEMRAQERSDEIKRISAGAGVLTRAQRFADAIRLIEDTLKKYPEDLPLTRLLRSTHADMQTFERERTVRQVLERCEGLRRAGKLQEALDVIIRLPAEIRNRRELLDLDTALRDEKTTADRAAAVRSASEEADALLRSGKSDQAVSLLDAAILSLGSDPALDAQLQKAQAAQQADRDRRYIESEIRHAKEFEQRGDIATSLKIIEEALLRSPASRPLLQLKERLNADRDHARNQREISEQAAAIEAALNRKEWPKVQEQLEAATKLFPMEGVFSRLGEEFRRREDEELDRLIADGHRLLDLGQVAEAEQFCLANLRDHRETPEVIALVQAIQEEKKRRKAAEAEETTRIRFVAECRRNAQGREEQGDLAGALNALQQGLQRYPQATDLKAAADRVSIRLAEANKRQLFVSIEQALARSDWERALPHLDQARRDYPNDSALIPLQDQALGQRSAFLDRAANAVRGKLRENKLDDARTLFSQNLARYRDLSVVQSVSAEIAAAESQLASEEQKRASIAAGLKESALSEQHGDLPRALAIIENALKSCPGEPQLTFAQNRLAAAVRSAEQARELSVRTAAIKKDLDRGNWDAALKKIEETRTAFPGNSDQLAALTRQAASLREAEIRTLVEKAREYLNQGHLPDAEKFLSKQLAPFSSEPAVLALANSLKQARSCEGLIETARNHTAGRRFDEAEAAINQFAALSPGHPEESRLRSALEAAREQERKDKLYRTGRAEADQLLRNRQYAEAITRFEYLLTQFPGDRQLQRDLDGAIAAERRKQTITSQGTVAAPVPASSSRTWIYIAAGAALAAIAGIAVWIYGPKPEPKPKTQQVATSESSGSATQPSGAPAHFDVQPGSLEFVFSNGAIPAQKITVDSSADIADPKTSVPWLTVKRNNIGPHKVEFTVSVSAKGLPRGSNTAELAFPEKRVPVELTVPGASEEAALDVRPLFLALSDSGSLRKTVAVSGPQPIPDPKPTDKWLRFARHNLGPGKVEFTVEALPDGLESGKTYNALLVFPQQKAVRVELTLASKAPKPVPPGPQPVEVQPSELSFVYNRIAAPAAQTVTVSGPPDLADPQKSAAWVSVARTSADATRFRYAVQILSPEKLDPGDHHDELLFAQQKKVRINLEVFDPPQRFCALKGRSFWTPGAEGVTDELDIKGARAIRGSGHVEPPLPTYEIVVDPAPLPSGVIIVANPSQSNNFTLRLRNTSGKPLAGFPINWSRK